MFTLRNRYKIFGYSRRTNETEKSGENDGEDFKGAQIFH